VQTLEPITNKLARAQLKLLHTAETIPEQLWRTAPQEGAWCGAEVIAHVIGVERAVICAADRIVRKQPKHIPLLKRFHVPCVLAEIRIVRLKTPVPIDTQLLREKESMFAEMREVRGRTLAFIGETSARDLRVYRWQHPFLGYLNAYEWFYLLASHQIRHEKQMREIAARLRRMPAAVPRPQK
jgi:hypothetical protein